MSRAEMLDEEFTVEISRAVGNLCALYFPGQVPKSRLMVLVDEASKQVMLTIVAWESLVPLFGRIKKYRDGFLPCFWKLRTERAAAHRMDPGHTIEEIFLCTQFSTWYDCLPLTPGDSYFMLPSGAWSCPMLKESILGRALIHIHRTAERCLDHWASRQQSTRDDAIIIHI